MTIMCSAAVLAIFPIAQRDRKGLPCSKKDMIAQWEDDIQEAASSTKIPAKIWQCRTAKAKASEYRLDARVADNMIYHIPIDSAIVTSERRQDLHQILRTMTRRCATHDMPVVAFLLPDLLSGSDLSKKRRASVPELKDYRLAIFECIKDGLEFSSAVDKALTLLPHSSGKPVGPISLWEPPVRAISQRPLQSAASQAAKHGATMIGNYLVEPSRQLANEEPLPETNMRIFRGDSDVPFNSDQQGEDQSYRVKSAGYRGPDHVQNSSKVTPSLSINGDDSSSFIARSNSESTRIDELEQLLQTTTQERDVAIKRIKVLQAENQKLKDDMLRKFYQIEEKERRIEELEKDMQPGSKRQRLS